MKFYSIRTIDGSVMFFPQDSDIIVITGVKMVDPKTGMKVLDGKNYAAMVIDNQTIFVLNELAILYLKMKAKNITEIK